jgi:hypothetical protein
MLMCYLVRGYLRLSLYLSLDLQRDHAIITTHLYVKELVNARITLLQQESKPPSAFRALALRHVYITNAVIPYHLLFVHA